MTASDARMWTIGELRAVLHHPVIGDNAEMRGYIQQTISEYQEGVSLLQGENSRKCKLLTAAWSPQVRLDRAEVLQHTACREAPSPRLFQVETWTPGTRVKEEAEPWNPGLPVKEEREELLVSPGGDGGQETTEEDVIQDPSSPGSVKTEDDDDEELALPPPTDPTEAWLPTGDSETDVKPEPQLLSCASDQYETTEPQPRPCLLDQYETTVKEEAGEESGARSGVPVGDLHPDLDSGMRIGRRVKFVEKLFHCPVCELKCVSKAHLRTHMRVHTGERPYSCPDCGKAFTTKGGANRHIRGIHHGDRPFRCEFCTFSFTFKSGLNRHLRVHTGERPYTCSFCGLSFTQSGNLTTHIDVHHRITSVKCKMKA
ncbi:unnamed protein product [Gadus morhua 'NCC']